MLRASLLSLALAVATLPTLAETLPEPEARTEVLTIRLMDIDGHATAVSGLLLHPTPPDGSRLTGGERSAVVVLHDHFAPDARTGDLAHALADHGWMVLALYLDPVSADGAAPSRPIPDTHETALLLGQVLAFLSADPRVNPNRIAAVGLGAGGRAALLAGSEHLASLGNGAYGPRFAAHAAFYPGCAALAREGFGAAAPWSAAPVALLHAGADEHDGPGDCEALGRDLLLAGRPPALWHNYPTATYAWDHGGGIGRSVRLPAPGGARVTVRTDAEVTADATDRLVRFLRTSLGAAPEQLGAGLPAGR